MYMGAKSSPLAQQIGAHLAENMRTDTDPGAVRRPAWATVEQVSSHIYVVCRVLRVSCGALTWW